ncbi:MAG: hypothetical protein R2857_02045 [Vampirovibrionales bacterium]
MLKIPNPEFEGQTKEKLGNSEVQGNRPRTMFGVGWEFDRKTPNYRNQVYGRPLSAREAARKARELTPT